MKFKRKIAVFLIALLLSNIIFYRPIEVQAGLFDVIVPSVIACVIGTEQSSTYQDWYQDVFSPKYKSALSEMFSAVGFPAAFGYIAGSSFAGDPVQNIRIWMANQLGTDGSNITDDQVKEKAYQMFNTSVVNNDNDSFTMSGDLNSFIQFMIEQYKTDVTPSYVYPFDLQLSNQTLQNNGIKISNAVPDDNDLIKHNGNANNSNESIKVYKDNGNLAFVTVDYAYGNPTGTLFEIYENNGIYSYRVPSFAYECVYDTSTGEYISGTGGSTNYTIISTQYPIGYSSYLGRGYSQFFSKKYKQILNFSSENALSAYINTYGIGKNPYYINESIYNDYSQSTGDYTLNNNNVNRVTYGDITTYIDDHHTETGNYPSLPDINIWIEEENTPEPTPTPTPNPDNPSSGGIGGAATATANNEGINITINNNHNLNIGGSSVSGNGLNGGTVSGNSGSGGDFFGWLGRVGDVIGNLIKGIGEALTGIFEGVAEAVTTIMESIPNILSPLFEFIFGGLPEEIKSLMTLGITCVIFIGVIKAIKR